MGCPHNLYKGAIAKAKYAHKSLTYLLDQLSLHQVLADLLRDQICFLLVRETEILSYILDVLRVNIREILQCHATCRIRLSGRIIWLLSVFTDNLFEADEIHLQKLLDVIFD